MPRDGALYRSGAPEQPDPVFVDPSGRRRRIATIAGGGLAAALLVSIGLLLAGLFTGSSLPLPGWPEQGRQPGREVLGGEPTAAPGATGTPTRTASAPVTGTSPTPPAAPPASRPPSASPSPSPTDRPGRGDERRATPRAGKPSKSPK